MKVKMILPALTEAVGSGRRTIKYSLFPPLGLATLAGYLSDTDEITIQDEHVEDLDLSDTPDLAVIEVYVTSAHRAYRIADDYRRRGSYVVMGGLHVTSLPDEAARHADTVFLGPGEDTWPAFLADFRSGHPQKMYRSSVRNLDGMPPVRRDLIKRHLYLVPNSVVISRGCPHKCEFCYKEAFFKGGKSYYTRAVDDALAEIEQLPGRHLFFLDDNLFADPHFAEALFDGMKGMGRVWQSAGTVQSVFYPGLLEKAVESGLSSLFVGFETLNRSSLVEQGKYHNLDHDYNKVVRRLHDAGVMINGSFVFGMDHDDAASAPQTVEWAIQQGIETATFHILTPYPGTALHERLSAEGRITSHDWDLYDTRHVVFQPAKMSPEALEAGYHQAYRDFYSWKSIFQSAWTKGSLPEKLRHVAYPGGWKKAEPVWDLAIRTQIISRFRPMLEAVLSSAHRNADLAKARAGIRISPDDITPQSGSAG